MAKTRPEWDVIMAGEYRATWDVTVKVAGYPDWPVVVVASREGMAKTMAMLAYPHPLGGQFVDYEVTQRT